MTTLANHRPTPIQPWGTVSALGRHANLLVAAVLSVAVLPAPASASPLFELLGAQLGHGGFNARATGPSAASAYFNPALLPQAEQGLELGFLVLNDAINVRLDPRNPSVDVPLENTMSVRDEFYPLPTIWLDDGCVPVPRDDPNWRGCLTDTPARPRQSAGSSGNTQGYAAVGYVTHLLDDRWSMGVYTIVRVGGLLRADSFLPDERAQYFSNSLHPELYSDRLNAMSLAFGTGVRITDWLSLGLSFTLNLSNEANATTFIGSSNIINETLVLRTEVDSQIGMAPHFSLLVEPIESLDLSLAVHTPQGLEIIADTATEIALGNRQPVFRKNVHFWLPLTLSLGAMLEVYRGGGHVFGVAGTGMYKRWSKYENRHGERPLPGYEWSDTLAGALGARYSHDEWLDTYLDVTYEPSPVPLQTGRTNYVDNDRFGTVGGATYTMAVEDWDLSFRFGAQAQLHVLRERHQSKLVPEPGNPNLVVDEFPDDSPNPQTGEPEEAAAGLQTNNPGWPGFASDGTLVAATLSVGLLY